VSENKKYNGSFSINFSAKLKICASIGLSSQGNKTLDLNKTYSQKTIHFCVAISGLKKSKEKRFRLKKSLYQYLELSKSNLHKLKL